MRFASLGSGSKGNGTLIEYGDTCVLLDLGFNVRETCQRLARLDRSPLDIKAIIVTHEHADHIKGVGPFARKFGTPVYMTFGTHGSGRAGALPRLHAINCHESLTIGALEVTPVTVPHDAREPCQFVFSGGDRHLGVLTDLGHITPHVVDQYRQLDGLLLECNHDPQLLIDGPYPWPLKRRVGGDHGHLNNAQAASLLDSIEQGGIQHLVVSHISEQNNTPGHARDAIDPVLRNFGGAIHLATQQEGFDWLDLN